MKPLKISALYLYPVKSCAGIRVTRLNCEAEGPTWDREWMIVGGDGNFVTQRELPRLALVQPHLHFAEGVLRFSIQSQKQFLKVPLTNSGTPLEVSIWDQPVEALDEGKEAADWLSDVMEKPLRLVRITKKNRRREGEDPRTIRFTDSYPLHLCSTSTLEDLNRRVGADSSLEMIRFRPNIVFTGAEPWAEDTWTSVEMAGKNFRVGKRCERCPITTVDPRTAQRGQEPLKTLAGFRRNARNKVEFGQYLHSVSGVVLEDGMEIQGLI